jgi:hypothetical protein
VSVLPAAVPAVRAVPEALAVPAVTAERCRTCWHSAVTEPQATELTAATPGPAGSAVTVPAATRSTPTADPVAPVATPVRPGSAATLEIPVSMAHPAWTALTEPHPTAVAAVTAAAA